MEFTSRPSSVASADRRRGHIVWLLLVALSLAALYALWLVAPLKIQSPPHHWRPDLANLREAPAIAQTVALHPVEGTFRPTGTAWQRPSEKPASESRPVVAGIRRSGDFTSARTVPPAGYTGTAWSAPTPATFANDPQVAAETVAALDGQVVRIDTATLRPQLVTTLRMTSTIDSITSPFPARRLVPGSWPAIAPSKVARVLSPSGATPLPRRAEDVAASAALFGKTVGRPVEFTDGHMVQSAQTAPFNVRIQPARITADDGQLSTVSRALPLTAKVVARAELASPSPLTAVAYDPANAVAPVPRREAVWSSFKDDGGDGRALDTRDLAAFPILRNPGWVPLGIPVAIPMGYYDLCKRAPSVCQASRGRRGWWSYEWGMHLDAALMKQLVAINAAVNRRIRQTSDIAQYHVVDRWVVDPQSRAGDCEDFALTKKARLIAEGWPSSVLLVALAKTRAGADHAVLIVRTDQGDLVLDSLRADIREWTPALYRWRSVQSPTDIWSWTMVGGEPAIATGFRNLPPIGDLQGASLALK